MDYCNSLAATMSIAQHHMFRYLNVMYHCFVVANILSLATSEFWSSTLLLMTVMFIGAVVCKQQYTGTGRNIYIILLFALLLKIIRIAISTIVNMFIISSIVHCLNAK